MARSATWVKVPRTVRPITPIYPKCKEVNYGGIANKENSKQYAGAVFLNETEQADTQKILDLGVKIFMQQTPGHKRENLTRETGPERR